jgi:hypothetical protein
MQMQNVNGVIEQLHLRSLFMDHLGFLNRNFGDFYTGRDMRRVRWLRSFFLMAQPPRLSRRGLRPQNWFPLC